MEQSDLLRLAIVTLEQQRIPYAIVGSFASGAWGEPRFTQDIHILIQLTANQVVPLCRVFAESDCYVNEAAALEAVREKRQFNIIQPASGNKIDFMIAGDEGRPVAQLQRRRRIGVFPDQDADFAAPEDVILGKLIYYREGGSEKHLRDIAGIIKFSGSLMDWSYLETTSNQFGLNDMLEAVRRRVSSL